MKVSVIIPTHNRCDLLIRAIESYFIQDYKNKELIILSDGCTDGTNEMLKKFIGNPNVKIITRDKGDTRTGHNVLWKECTGDLICQIHDDDQMNEGSISVRVKEFMKNDFTEVVWGGVIHQNIKGEQIGLFLGESPNAARCLNVGYINFTAMMWKNSIKEKFMIDESFVYQLDDMFKAQCLMECACVAIKEPVMRYTIHEGQETRRGRLNGEMAIEIETMKIKLKKLYGL
ncbi:MAG: glycosyltransferase family A protein [Bacteroidota bacterium]